MPDTLFHSPLTIGGIRFGPSEISGHFEAMLGVGLPHGRCEFHGKKRPGPAIVALSIQEVIDDWNDYGIFSEDEAPRSPSPNSDTPNDEVSKSATTSSSSTAPKGSAKEDQKAVLGSIIGAFDITSEAVEGEWPSMSRDLTVRFDIDKQQEKVRGQFDVGIADGYLLFSLPPDRLRYNTPIGFRWRGRESETGSPINGSGEVTVREDRTTRGVFRGMAGNVDFKGKRKFMPSARSGHDIDYYRRGWEEYAYGEDSHFYGSSRGWHWNRQTILTG